MTDELDIASLFEGMQPAEAKVLRDKIVTAVRGTIQSHQAERKPESASIDEEDSKGARLRILYKEPSKHRAEIARLEGELDTIWKQQDSERAGTKRQAIQAAAPTIAEKEQRLAALTNEANRLMSGTPSLHGKRLREIDAEMATVSSEIATLKRGG